MPNNTISSTTQQFLDIFDITNNFVIMKDGTTSVIIQVDAMNFGLLAEEEQDSVMYAYAGLLNSLNYTVQILIRSQTKDVTGYLRLLKQQEDDSLNRDKQRRIQKYREFVSNLIRERNVLDKKFYVVIPAAPVELGILPPSSVLPGKGEVKITSVDRNLIIEKAKNLLEPKRDHLIAQFARIGLYSRQLETQEIIQLFYLSYNPEAGEGQQIGESKTYTPPMVAAQIEGGLMFNDSQIPGSQAQGSISADGGVETQYPPPQEPSKEQRSELAQSRMKITTPEEDSATQMTQAAQAPQPAQPTEQSVVQPPTQQLPTQPVGQPPQQPPTQPSGQYKPTQMNTPSNNIGQTVMTPGQPTQVSPSNITPPPEIPGTPKIDQNAQIPVETGTVSKPSSGGLKNLGSMASNSQKMPPLPEI